MISNSALSTISAACRCRLYQLYSMYKSSEGEQRWSNAAKQKNLYDNNKQKPVDAKKSTRDKQERLWAAEKLQLNPNEKPFQMKRKSVSRSAIRKEQSQKDRVKALTDRSAQFSAYRQFLEDVKNVGMEGEHTRIPLDLIDLTATLIATMISGHSYLKYFVAPTIGIEKGDFDIMQELQSDINFIRKTLNMARISCTSLVISLWYVDTFFHHKSKRPLRQRKLDDVSTNLSRVNPAEGWSTRDLFMASIVIADKYLADVTWSNAEWSYNTGGYYTCESINRLERQFLQQIDFKLFVTDDQYRHFCSYLEDVSILSQSLLPIYAERLRLSLRPYEAIMLLAKMVALTFAIYIATLVTLAAAAYIIHLQAELIQQHIISTAYSQMHTMCEYIVVTFARAYHKQS